MLTLQQIMQRLSTFWEKEGCVLHQGHDLEMGAGTFNPATFLRCLGPEPYKTAYVEPSRRPKDARYGENPNRVQLFHQYQVIIKPPPEDIQQTYIRSIEALGYDLSKHDIRFVHDDWEGPTLGAWGLGWEVWLDGMEVTQYTYFQAVGSLPLYPTAVEITYGLERLAMYIQNVDNIFDVHWNDKLTLRDITLENEIEWSKYNFEESSTAMWGRHFEDFEKEAKRLIGVHLPLPAYDFVIKASHAFNMLEARGAISVTERTGYIARIRELARLIAVEYVSSREKLGFPLLKEAYDTTLPKTHPLHPKFDPAKKEDFLLEIGSEQLPATFVGIGCTNLQRAMRQLLEKHELSFEDISVYGTPQRLAVIVKGLSEGKAPKTVQRKGPPLQTVFNENGHLSPQGEGFFKSVGLSHAKLSDIQQGKIKELSLQNIKGVDYLFATIEHPGQSTAALLQEELPKLILGLDFPKKMRWDIYDTAYPRPLRWVIALFGKELIPFHLGVLASGHKTRGHAQRSPGFFNIEHPSTYLETLKKHFVIADVAERKASIEHQLEAIEKKLSKKALDKSRVLAEVLHLVEWPELTYADFDPRFLKAPQEVLISEMVEHQRYFPLADQHGKLAPKFVITADNTPTDEIRKGNQKVLSARLSDGVFLYEEDLQTPLESFNEKLKVMTFQKELGSMFDKVMRIVQIAEIVNEELDIADQKKLRRAALLCKADLASHLVGEFPELQGTIGKYYANAQNEDPEVALAIEEHWMPRGEGGALPETPVGIVLCLADKIDNLLGYFSAGLKPTSSSDPYALRRQTIGILQILIKGKEPVDLKKILEKASQLFPLFKKENLEEILQFITARCKAVLEDQGFKKDEIEASLQGVCTDPYDQYCKVEALHQFRKMDAFGKLWEVFKRAKGQLDVPSTEIFNPSLATEKAEVDLVHALERLQKHWTSTLKDRNYTRAFELTAELQPAIAHLFDTVKILADDIQLRNNRIALLQKVFAHFQELLDFSKIQVL